MNKSILLADAYGLDLASEYAVEMDPHNAELYTMHRFSKHLQSQCTFDALFRLVSIENVAAHDDSVPNARSRNRINSMFPSECMVEANGWTPLLLTVTCWYLPSR
jgi:hypothetical protein